MISPSAIEEFKASLRGELLRPSDAGYDEARKIWNGMIDKRPALIARCTGAADVIQAVNFARNNDLLVAVRGGGHNIAGNAVCDGGLVIDLTRMKGIRIDPARRTVRAEAGLTWREFDRETQAFGLATTGGQISTAGIAGLTLGGGWGYLARRYGLSCDNLLSADVVTADGQLLTASATEHADLFWALCGGGGNFGVVTSFEYQLHAVGPVFAGIVAYPIQKAKTVLELFRQVTSGAPDELACDIVLITLPDGTAIVGMNICYNGPIAEGERLCGHSGRLGRQYWIRSAPSRIPQHNSSSTPFILPDSRATGNQAFSKRSAMRRSTRWSPTAASALRRFATGLSSTS
jgi:FAD binding domain